jgi:anti-sigma B factor antagonist
MVQFWSLHKACSDCSAMVGGLEVREMVLEERVVVAPEELGLDSRNEFRREAFSRVDHMRRGAGRLVIDLSATRSVDSTGLGALIMVQRRAVQRRVHVTLRGVNEELRFLLVLTKLEDLFEVETTDSP